MPRGLLTKKESMVARAMVLACATSFLLLGVRVLATGSLRLWFLSWNLVLAVVPLVLTFFLRRRVRKHGWLDYRPVILIAVAIAFLPNSFYIISDFIHLSTSPFAWEMFDIVLISSFAINGLILGYTSLLVMHVEVERKVKPIYAHLFATTVLFLCSFAIYLGRYLRWNSWDILLEPAGLIIDVSDRIINPANHPTTFSTTLLFFMLLGSIYVVVWQGYQALKK